MLLAGGQEAASTLTRNLAKPAVPLAANTASLIFPCPTASTLASIRWGAAQYQPRCSMIIYRQQGPGTGPEQRGYVLLISKSSGSDWYRGTASAIYQNIHFIDRYQQYVAILSGDHIYKMDYSKMPRVHKEKG